MPSAKEKRRRQAKLKKNKKTRTRRARTEPALNKAAAAAAVNAGRSRVLADMAATNTSTNAARPPDRDPPDEIGRQENDTSLQSSVGSPFEMIDAPARQNSEQEQTAEDEARKSPAKVRRSTSAPKATKPPTLNPNAVSFEPGGSRTKPNFERGTSWAEMDDDGDDMDFNHVPHLGTPSMSPMVANNSPPSLTYSSQQNSSPFVLSSSTSPPLGQHIPRGYPIQVMTRPVAMHPGQNVNQPVHMLRNPNPHPETNYQTTDPQLPEPISRFSNASPVPSHGSSKMGSDAGWEPAGGRSVRKQSRMDQGGGRMTNRSNSIRSDRFGDTDVKSDRSDIPPSRGPRAQNVRRRGPTGAPRRLMWELKNLKANPFVAYVYNNGRFVEPNPTELTAAAEPVSDDNILEWHANVRAQGGPMDGAIFHFIIDFPEHYPAASPDIESTVPLPHENCQQGENGKWEICLKMLNPETRTLSVKDKATPYNTWSCAYTVESILTHLQAMLSEIDEKSSLNGTDAHKAMTEAHSYVCQITPHSPDEEWPSLEIAQDNLALPTKLGLKRATSSAEAKRVFSVGHKERERATPSPPPVSRRGSRANSFVGRYNMPAILRQTTVRTNRPVPTSPTNRQRYKIIPKSGIAYRSAPNPHARVPTEVVQHNTIVAVVRKEGDWVLVSQGPDRWLPVSRPDPNRSGMRVPMLAPLGDQYQGARERWTLYKVVADAGITYRSAPDMSQRKEGIVAEKGEIIGVTDTIVDRANGCVFGKISDTTYIPIEVWDNEKCTMYRLLELTENWAMLDALDEALLAYALSFLSPRDLSKSCARVCSTFQRCAKRAYLWANVFCYEVETGEQTTVGATRWRAFDKENGWGSGSYISEVLSEDNYQLMKRRWLTECAVVRAGCRCYYSKLTFEEDILGIGIVMDYNPGKRKFSHIDSDFNLISASAFYEDQCRFSKWGKPITKFLPMYLTEQHFRRALPELRKCIVSLCPNWNHQRPQRINVGQEVTVVRDDNKIPQDFRGRVGKFIKIESRGNPKQKYVVEFPNQRRNYNDRRPRRNRTYTFFRRQINGKGDQNVRRARDGFVPAMVLNVLPTLMCTKIVLLANGGSDMQGSLRGLILLHRLFIALIEEYPDLKKQISDKVGRFIRTPKARWKNPEGTPNMGHFLCLISVCDEYGWEKLAGPVMDESLDRNVLWIGRKFPDNTYLEPRKLRKVKSKDRASAYTDLKEIWPRLADPNYVDAERLRVSWQATIFSKRLYMIHNTFWKNVIRNRRIMELGDFYDIYYGYPSEALMGSFNSKIQAAMNVMDQRQYYSTMGLLDFSAHEMTMRLYWAWAKSLEKGYHNQHWSKEDFLKVARGDIGIMNQSDIAKDDKRRIRKAMKKSGAKQAMMDKLGKNAATRKSIVDHYCTCMKECIPVSVEGLLDAYACWNGCRTQIEEALLEATRQALDPDVKTASANPPWKYWEKTLFLGCDLWLQRFRTKKEERAGVEVMDETGQTIQNIKLEMGYERLIGIAQQYNAREEEVVAAAYNELRQDASWERLCELSDAQLQNQGDWHDVTRQDDPRVGIVHTDMRMESVKELSKRTASSVSEEYDVLLAEIGRTKAQVAQDLYIYLERMHLVARVVNPPFQHRMRGLLMNFGVFKEGPIKEMQRCREKCLTKYGPVRGSDGVATAKQWPSAAHILDIVRCSLICKAPNDMIQAFTHLLAYAKDSKDIMVARVKNMFSESATINKEAGLYRDIKLNILFQTGTHRMVCELQMILDPVIKFKKRVHHLYKVIRAVATFEEKLRKR